MAQPIVSPTSAAHAAPGSAGLPAVPRATRLPSNPIITPELSPTLGRNINGPSLIRVPDWVERPLGRYYLYFAHHQGTFIRMAYADSLEGPWTVHEPGVLSLEQSLFRGHVASPDVHVDLLGEGKREIRMYVHGPTWKDRGEPEGQWTRVALSSDGLHFTVLPELHGISYFRVFRWGGWVDALATAGVFYRSRDGLTGFERGPVLFDPQRFRHAAIRLRPAGSLTGAADGSSGGSTAAAADGAAREAQGQVCDRLEIYYSLKGDCPERIVVSTVDLTDDWHTWRASPPETVLAPELPWEGIELPLRPSIGGWAPEPVRELRDPGIYQEDGRTYLLYSIAGEQGIAIAELTDGD
jgi:hypothetical protein